MIKRLNFTGRRRIPRDRIEIEVDGQSRVFNAAVNLDGLEFVERAKVILEATCAGSTLVPRYDFGEVGSVRKLENEALNGLGGERVNFTVKVVDQTIGRILGIAENIQKPICGDETSEIGRKGILPIEQVDLGRELWKLEFGEQNVTLLVNKHVPGLADRARGDPLLYAMIYPEIVRRVLERAIYVEHAEIEDNDRWPVLWLRFGRDLHPTHDEPPADDDQDACDDWIDEIVQTFCEKHSLKRDYMRAINVEDEGIE